MRVEVGSRNCDLQVFQDAQAHMLTPLQTHAVSRAKHLPE